MDGQTDRQSMVGGVVVWWMGGGHGGWGMVVGVMGGCGG